MGNEKEMSSKKKEPSFMCWGITNLEKDAQLKFPCIFGWWEDVKKHVFDGQSKRIGRITSFKSLKEALDCLNELKQAWKSLEDNDTKKENLDTQGCTTSSDGSSKVQKSSMLSKLYVVCYSKHRMGGWAVFTNFLDYRYMTQVMDGTWLPVSKSKVFMLEEVEEASAFILSEIQKSRERIESAKLRRLGLNTESKVCTENRVEESAVSNGLKDTVEVNEKEMDKLDSSKLCMDKIDIGSNNGNSDTIAVPVRNNLFVDEEDDCLLVRKQYELHGKKRD